VKKGVNYVKGTKQRRVQAAVNEQILKAMTTVTRSQQTGVLSSSELILTRTWVAIGQNEGNLQWIMNLWPRVDAYLAIFL
jgi:hypothetical protein